MKFEKTKTKKVETPTNVIGETNAKILTKIKTKKDISVKTEKSNPKPDYKKSKKDSKNLQGVKAYSKEDFTNLLTLLNTLKLDGDQFYRTESQSILDVKSAVEKCASQDVYFTAQCIRWSRTNGEGLRSVTQLAAAFLASYLSGKDFARYFYSRYNKSSKIGGVIYRIDDAVQLSNIYFSLTKNSSLPNSIRKGLVSALENADTYELSKYKNTGIVDIINLVHPNPNNSTAVVEVDGEKYRKILNAKIKSAKSPDKISFYKDKLSTATGKKVTIKTLDALILGVPFLADTHETRNTQAGQIISESKKSGAITEREAVELMQEAVSSNFKELLQTGKLGVLAALRNITRMVQSNIDNETLSMLKDMFTNPEVIRKSLVHPMQIDIAYEMISSFNDKKNSSLVRELQSALQKGFELAIPNLTLQGKTCVMIDVSGSMTSGRIYAENKHSKQNSYSSTPAKKSYLIAATLAKSVNADIVLFDTRAHYMSYDPNSGVFDLANKIERKASSFGGSTSISSAFNLIADDKKTYNQIILLSDNEANTGNTAKAAQRYFREINYATVYSVDLQSYGTTQLVGENIYQLFGYGFTMFEDMQKRQFDANAHLTEVEKVRFINQDR